MFVLDPDGAAQDDTYPEKLNDAVNLGKFIEHQLPRILQEMCRKYNWSSIPRTVVHDKATYMVSSGHNRLHMTFASALKAANLQSWVGDSAASAEWLAPRWGDVYPHETVISHVRRLLENDFMCSRLNETYRQFTARMKKVEDHLNSPAFQTVDGGGLMSLAKSMRKRCELVKGEKGGRIPK